MNNSPKSDEECKRHIHLLPLPSTTVVAACGMTTFAGRNRSSEGSAVVSVVSHAVPVDWFHGVYWDFVESVRQDILCLGYILEILESEPDRLAHLYPKLLVVEWKGG
jgi:hypothetical protein